MKITALSNHKPGIVSNYMIMVFSFYKNINNVMDLQLPTFRKYDILIKQL